VAVSSEPARPPDEPVPSAALAQVAAPLLRLAKRDTDAASAALAPLLDDFARVAGSPIWAVLAFLLEALSLNALGDAGGSERALERALDLAEPDGLLLPFVLHPGAKELLERHSPYRTTHASLISDALALLAGSGAATGAAERHPLPEPLSESERRVLRYLPTNLSKQEIAHELCVSVHTVKTHVHHLYTKLDVHCRREAVTRARTLGLLAPSACG
jgi:LuxR family transcriptional regulator, maltose regulon positive regulatory protein